MAARFNSLLLASARCLASSRVRCTAAGEVCSGGGTLAGVCWAARGNLARPARKMTPNAADRNVRFRLLFIGKPPMGHEPHSWGEWREGACHSQEPSMRDQAQTSPLGKVSVVVGCGLEIS